MKIVVDGDGKFVALSSFEEKDLLKNSGFYWDSKLRKWWTNDVEKAMLLSDFFDQSTWEYLVKLEERKQQEMVESSKTYSDFHVPLPNGISLYPYQRAGVEFLVKHKNVMLADEQRLGKTYQTLGFVNVARPKDVLIVCPATVKSEWKYNAEKLLVDEYNIQVIGKDFPLPSVNGRNFYIINYDILKKWEPMLRRKWDVIVFDESHKLKNRGWAVKRVVDGKEVVEIKGTERTYIATQLSNYADKIILLTGTPIMNRPDEFFTQLKIAKHPLGRSWKKFADRFLIREARSNWVETVGYKNLEEFSQILRQGFMMRRTREQVFPQLPTKTRELIPVDINDIELTEEVKMRLDELLRKYDGLIRNIEQLDAEVRSGNNENRKEWEEKIKQLKGELYEMTVGEISHYRKILSEKKVNLTIKFVDDLLEEVKQVVIFGHYTSTLLKLKEHYGDKAGLLIGDTPLKQREEERIQFNQGEKELMIVSTRAGGEGVSYSSADIGVFIDWDWNPKVMEQAEDRLVDITQNRPKMYYYIIVDKTIDAYIAKKILEKEALINKVMDKI